MAETNLDGLSVAIDKIKDLERELTNIEALLRKIDYGTGNRYNFHIYAEEHGYNSIPVNRILINKDDSILLHNMLQELRKSKLEGLKLQMKVLDISWGRVIEQEGLNNQ